MAGDGMLFGAHSVTHPFLSRVTLERARQEIADSGRRLTEMIGEAPGWFCYPQGGPPDYTAQVRDLVAKLGYRGCFVAYPKHSVPEDVYALPRTGVGADMADFRWTLCGAEILGLRLRRWLGLTADFSEPAVQASPEQTPSPERSRMGQAPLISVITATYNMGRYVREAVESVLAQDWPAIEVIVVDDGSTDETARVLEAYADDPRVKVICQANAGQTVAKNVGLRAARGDYIGFCDADNAWLPGKLVRQVPLLQANRTAGVTYGDIVPMDAEGRPLPMWPAKRYGGWITQRLLLENFVTFNTTLLPRQVVEEFGGFDESLSMAIDYDLWLRISAHYEFIYLNEPLVRYRIWGGQMSHRIEERFANVMELVERFLATHPGCVTPTQANEAWARNYAQRGHYRAGHGRWGGALQDYWRAFRHRPYDGFLWRSMARSVLRR
jgi:glycosyltransferase involved in cell wall biosynthesis